MDRNGQNIPAGAKDDPAPGGDRHALVIGGSLAGLLAARVLSDHFERVTLIERDGFPAGAENRRGVPQGRHSHVLLAKGREIHERLFPDLMQALRDGGAPFLDIGADLRWYHFGGYKIQFPSGLIIPSMSRPYFESEVRRRVLALWNLRCMDAGDVKGLVATSDRARITGVRIKHRAIVGEETLAADLVVDASGRGSQTPVWLEALGYARPEEVAIKVNVGYTSRIYRRRPGDLQGCQGACTLPTPPREKRLGALLPIEGNRWLVTLGGWLGDHAPADEQGFLEFARSLPTPDCYNVIQRSEPLTDFAVHKFPSNLRRRYERLSRFPEGLLVTGDAMCSFNPIYGQGMTVCALEADALDACLKGQRRSDLRGLARRFFQRAAKIIDAPWSLAAGEDWRYQQAEGASPIGAKLTNWYIARIHRAATHDLEIYRAFLEVMNLMRPPSLMFAPRVALRLFGKILKGRRQAERASLMSAGVQNSKVD